MSTMGGPPESGGGPGAPARGQRGTIVRMKLRCDTLDDVRARHPELKRARFTFRTKQERPVGTPVRLEASLRSGVPAFTAMGTLEALRGAGTEAPTWTLAFGAMDEPGRELVAWMGGTPPRELEGTPPPAASATPPPVEPEPPLLDQDAFTAVEPTRETPVASTARFTPVPPPAPRPPPAARPAPGPPAGPPQASTPGQRPPPAPEPSLAPPGRRRPTAQVGPPPRLAPSAAPEPVPDEEIPEAPQAQRGGPIIGIDLGTNNSAVAVVKNGKPFIIPSREGWSTIPSVVALTEKGSLVVGHFARDRMLVNPRSTVHGAKRLIGRQFDSPVVKDLAGRFTYEIVAGPRGEAAVKLGDRAYSLQKISSMVLSTMKELAEQWMGEEVGRAVVTVPAYYNDNQRQAVRAAGALAGLQVERIVNEPTAAAIAFAQGRRLEQRVLVYDLGGGTFDCSILELHGNVYEVVSTGGDTFLGGVDFDQALVADLLARFRKAHGVDFSGDRVAYQRIVDAAERAKIALSERLATDVNVPFVTVVGSDAYALKTTVTRTELEALTRGLVERTLRVCEEVLANGGMKPSEVGEVLLVGGQSRMPLVRSMVRAFFGKEPSKAVHPDEAVALGAALLAHSVQSGEIGGIVLVDVLPMSIGIGLPGGRFKKVIGRNTPLPHRRAHAIWTSGSKEKTLSIPIFQGESDHAQENEYLGTLLVADLPPGVEGDVVFDVIFSISAESILTVTAEERGTARSVSATFSTQDTPETVRRRMEARAGIAAEPAQRSAPPRPPQQPAEPAAGPTAASPWSRALRWVKERLGRS